MRKFRCVPVGEVLSQDKHKEFESRNTRVSEYLRKYGTGRIDQLPTDTRPEIKDSRTTDEMLSEVDKLTGNISTEELDVLVELENKKEDFEKAIADIQLTAAQKKKYDAAMKVLNDSNSSYDAKSDAIRILDELKQAGKITRT